ncbi:hypothetical protein TNCV_2298441 [Trichonephila clavipes]|nr:hypothetical protein TNCV_2298441 [Trichonephila clavipes]
MGQVMKTWHLTEICHNIPSLSLEDDDDDVVSMSERNQTEPWVQMAVLAREKTLGWSGAFHLSFPSTNHAKGLVARRLFRVPPCRKGTIHLQTSMSSPGFEPSPYGTAVSVANHYTGWDGYFQVDNAPCHAARIVNRWFEESERDFTLLSWPTESPDLKPVENLGNNAPDTTNSPLLKDTITEVVELWFGVEISQGGYTDLHVVLGGILTGVKVCAGHACSHPRVPRAHQSEFSRRSLAGVGLSESVRCHGPGLALLTDGGVQQQHKKPFSAHF